MAIRTEHDSEVLQKAREILDQMIYLAPANHQLIVQAVKSHDGHLQQEIQQLLAQIHKYDQMIDLQHMEFKQMRNDKKQFLDKMNRKFADLHRLQNSWK